MRNLERIVNKELMGQFALILGGMCCASFSCAMVCTQNLAELNFKILDLDLNGVWNGNNLCRTEAFYRTIVLIQYRWILRKELYGMTMFLRLVIAFRARDKHYQDCYSCFLSLQSPMGFGLLRNFVLSLLWQLLIYSYLQFFF